MNLKVLVAEDEPGVAQKLQKIISENGSEPILSRTGKMALDVLARDSFNLVITDLSSVEKKAEQMMGLNYLKEIQSLQSAKAPIVVLTSQNESKLIIDSFRHGIHDYLIKPMNGAELTDKIRDALEFSRIRTIQQTLEREHSERLQEKLSWHSWKEGIIYRERDRFEQNFFHNIRVALNQGAGFGMLLSLLSTFLTGNLPGESVQIEPDVLELLRVNQQVAHRTIEVFTELDRLTNEEMPLERLSLYEFYDMLNQVSVELSPYSAIHSQKFVITSPGEKFQDTFFLCNRQFMKKVVQELFMNALKFSEPGSEIYVLLNNASQETRLAVLNYPRQLRDIAPGVPAHLEKSVFEPFSRLTSTIDEQYDTLDYGLGLTMVDKIMHRHNGSINITNVVDHISPGRNDDSILVSVNLSIPLEI